MDASPAVLVLTPAARATAEHIAAGVPRARLHGLAHRVSGTDVAFAETLDHIRALYQAGAPIIGVCASGILIRALAAVITDKRSEPPVVVVSEDGTSVVPLLGGHRGANQLARDIAALTGGHAAVTTAGDTALGVPLDAPPRGWRLQNINDAKGVMARLLAGEPVMIDGTAPWLPTTRLPVVPAATLRLVFTERAVKGDADTLVYHPCRLAIGVGASRGCPPEELIALVRGALAEADLAEGAVAVVTSLDLKADEPAMQAAADTLGVPFRVFSAEALEAETPRLANPSGVVFAEVGCHGVAEGAALAAAGPEGSLVVGKRKSANATVAIARAPAPLDPKTVGRSRGRLAVIGIGPGSDAWRTPEASRLLLEAEEVVGYGLYLDLVAPLIQGKPRHAYPLGAEEGRVRFALERAGQGRSVALVSSGDAGIYAMGALVFELLDRAEEDGGVSAQAKRIEVVAAPGISALQAVAARIGAPLGHDFCAISLSDLLTPWETIERRIKAAAEGDFVIAFYNPVSQRRRSQLAAAREILLQHRPPQTPVVLGVNLGRVGETVRATTLEALTVEEVDMLTTVLVGSSQSKMVPTGSGKPFVYTPRGYAKRIEGQE